MQLNTLTRQGYRGKTNAKILEKIMQDPKQDPDLKPFEMSDPGPIRKKSFRIHDTEYENMWGLKELSSEMDLAKINIYQKAVIKERGAEIYSKIRPPPIL